MQLTHLTSLRADYLVGTLPPLDLLSKLTLLMINGRKTTTFGMYGTLPSRWPPALEILYVVVCLFVCISFHDSVATTAICKATSLNRHCRHCHPPYVSSTSAKIY
jgi:hypothetical protein